MTNPLFSDADDRCRRGKHLSKEEAVRLEQHLGEDSTDVDARLALIGFYSRSDASSLRRRNKHVLSLIEHAPQIPTRTYGIVFPESDPSDYEEGKTRWERAMEAHPRDAAVALNASWFVLLFEPHLGDRWLQEGKARNGGALDWALAIAGYCEWRLTQMTANPDARSLGERALGGYLEAIVMLGDDLRWLQFLWSMRQCAAAAGLRDAVRLLRLADQEATRVTASGVHPAERAHRLHTVRGLLSLVRGDVEGAEGHLGAAAAVPDLRTLPATSLASELLAAGREAAVLAYLRDARRQALAHIDLLDSWLDGLESGQRPDWSTGPGDPQRQRRSS